MALRFFSSSLETDQRKEIMHKCTLQVSYNAAGVLAHMASDGPEAWTVRQPERFRIASNNHEMADKDHNRKDGGENIIFRSFVLDRMVRAINRWDISSSRNINYRSFAPIIR